MRKRVYNRWSPEATEFLYALYGLRDNTEIANQLNGRFGMKLNSNLVASKAKKLGLDYRDAQGLLTLADAARELGIHYQRLQCLIKRRGWETTGKAKARFLTEETWAQVRAYYQQPPEPTISIPEAQRRLCYEKSNVHRLIRIGQLKAYKCGIRWRVSVASVEAMLRARKHAPKAS